MREDFIVAGSADCELRVWQITEIKKDEPHHKVSQTLLGEDDCSNDLVK